MPDPDATRQLPPYDVDALNRLANVLSGGLIALAGPAEHDPKTMTLEEACAYSERDVDDPAERGEVEVALWLLVAYGLAKPAGDEWRATLAAIKAEEIDF